jgi:hypothetical protein
MAKIGNNGKRSNMYFAEDVLHLSGVGHLDDKFVLTYGQVLKFGDKEELLNAWENYNAIL